jgi:hypothetical protein
MKDLSRRSFTKDFLGSLLSFSLVQSLYEHEMLASTIKPIAHQWLIELERLSKDLKSRKLKQTEWQKGVAELFARVELTDVLRAINFDRLASRLKLSPDREAIREIKFPSLAGVPTELTCSTFFNALKKDRAIAPHGHRNMATMHLLLRGQVHLRQYDRVRDEPDYLIVRPTVDKSCGAGELSTISDDKNNVHWFRGSSEVTYIFNVGIYGLNPSEGFTGREYIDPNGGQQIKDEELRVRKLNQTEAFRLYNKA